MPNESLEQATKEQPRISTVKKVGAAVLSAVVLSGGVSGKYYGDDWLLWPKQAIGYLNDESCGDGSPQAMARVEQALQKPEAPKLTALFDELNAKREGQLLERQHQIHEQWLPKYIGYITEQAKDHGLSVVNPTPYLGALAETNKPSEMLNIANALAIQYGFKLELATRRDLRDIGYKFTTLRSPIDADEFKSGLDSFLRAWIYVPVEIVRDSGLKRIKLVEKIDHKSLYRRSTGPGAQANPASGTVYMSVESFKNGGREAYIHELGHMIDYDLCGLWGMLRDITYAGQNPASFRYGHLQPSGSTRQQVASNYGLEHIVEDKAEVFSHILDGFDREILDEPSVVADKYKQLLGRIEQKFPGYAEYLASITRYYA